MILADRTILGAEKNKLFRLEIQSIEDDTVKLLVVNRLSNEQLAKVCVTAFEGIKERDPMVLRVIFFAALESLKPESEMIRSVWALVKDWEES